MAPWHHPLGGLTIGAGRPRGYDFLTARARDGSGRPAWVSLETELAELVGGGHVLVDPELTSSYEVDWTRRFRGRCRVVVRPASTEEVSGVLIACRRAGVAVVVQGGNTGLVGGATPAGGEVLLSTTRLRELGPVDSATGQVTVGAGATLAAVQAHVRARGLDVGVDLGSRESATIGGMVATNAGGEHVVRHGPMRSQTLGLEAVLSGGQVLAHLSGLPKENTGYDWVGLLAGSEGTLAVLTRVRLRLVSSPAARAVALVGCADTAAAIATLAELRRRLSSLEAAEVFFATGLELVRAHTGLAHPLAKAHPAYLLVETTGQSGQLDPTDALVSALEGLGQARDAVLVTDSADRRSIWRYREAHTEAISAAGVPVKLDVALPTGALADFVEALPALVADSAPSARVIVFGHLAEGNLHVNVLNAEGREDAVTERVLRAVVAVGGSVSAEHGVGRAKVAWLSLSRSPAELAAMAALKAALDPTWSLAPGVVLPPR
jgi:FAD/FMN-containing dehydrogenase